MIAYCISAHKNPSQVRRLLKSIYSPSDLFYVNIFGISSRLEEEIWREKLKDYCSENFCINYKYRNVYATFELVNGFLDAIRYFSIRAYDYLINLSGQCYPLRSAEYIKRFFDKRDASYIRVARIPEGWPEASSRLLYSYYRVPSFGLIDFVARAFGRSIYGGYLFIRIPRIHGRLPYQLDAYGGSGWNCISRKHVDYILEFIKEMPDIVGFFRRVWAPDEHFFQTIIMNSPLKSSVVDDDLWYADWSGKKGRHGAATLTMDDADNLMHARASKLFARKFDNNVDEEILDFVDGLRKKD